MEGGGAGGVHRGWGRVLMRPHLCHMSGTIILRSEFQTRTGQRERERGGAGRVETRCVTGMFVV